MQATSTIRGAGPSRSAVGFLIGLMAALLIGAVAGFAARTWTVGDNATTTGVAIKHQQAPDAIDRNAALRDAQLGGPQSDLTRALPTAAPSIVGGPQSDLTRALPTAAPGLLDRGAERQQSGGGYIGGGYYIP